MGRYRPERNPLPTLLRERSHSIIFYSYSYDRPAIPSCGDPQLRHPPRSAHPRRGAHRRPTPSPTPRASRHPRPRVVGRILASETDAPNMLANLVRRGRAIVQSDNASEPPSHLASATLFCRNSRSSASSPAKAVQREIHRVGPEYASWPSSLTGKPY